MVVAAFGVPTSLGSVWILQVQLEGGLDPIGFDLSCVGGISGRTNGLIGGVGDDFGWKFITGDGRYR